MTYLRITVSLANLYTIFTQESIIADKIIVISTLKYFFNVMYMKVFVCEDDKDITELIEILILDLGYEVKSCGEAVKIMALMKDFEPDLIVVDYWLKGMKADELIALIKSDKDLENVPLVLISAIDNLEQVARQLGVLDYIKKPFDIVEFQTKIKQFAK